jgi:hypothetical protein
MKKRSNEQSPPVPLPATTRRATAMWSSATTVTGTIPNSNRFSRDTTEYPQPTPRNADSASPVTPPVTVKSRRKQTTPVPLHSKPSAPAESLQQAASSAATSQEAGPTQSSPSPLSSQSAAGPKSCGTIAATPTDADVKWAIHPIGEKFISPFSTSRSSSDPSAVTPARTVLHPH